MGTKDLLHEICSDISYVMYSNGSPKENLSRVKYILKEIIEEINRRNLWRPMNAMERYELEEAEKMKGEENG